MARKRNHVDNLETKLLIQEIEKDPGAYNKEDASSKTFHGRFNYFANRKGIRTNAEIWKQLADPLVREAQFEANCKRFERYISTKDRKDRLRPTFGFVIGVSIIFGLSKAEVNKMLDSANLGHLHSWRLTDASRGDAFVIKYYDSIVEKYNSPSSADKAAACDLIKQMNLELTQNGYDTVEWNI